MLDDASSLLIINMRLMVYQISISTSSLMTSHIIYICT